MAKKKNIFKSILKASVVIVCAFGFLWQTLEFFFLYRTYPTVVDIQVSVPPEIDLPGITLCSGNNIIPESICKLGGTCTRPKMWYFINPCIVFPSFCINNKVPDGFTAVRYYPFMQKNELNQSSIEKLRVPLDDFLKCKIVGGGKERPCDTQNVVIGSYYSDSYSPNFCFSLNTQWGDPKKKIQKIKKSERIVIEAYIDISYRNRSAPPELVQLPAYNGVSSSTLQMAIHSQKVSASPFVSGQGFIGGKKYHIKLKKEEKHLLPPPYQTNCTDYTIDWLGRGGVAPLNQLMVIQECRLNASVKELGCVPYFIDFPHNEVLCQHCSGNCSNITKVGENCTELLAFYNQPCDSSVYEMAIEEKLVYNFKTFTSDFMDSEETLIIKSRGYNCSFENLFSRQCQTVNIELDFDEYEVTNLTYNPKFETLELFSVIGGYMGMYLGISLVAVYDFLEMALISTLAFLKKKKNSKTKAIKKKFMGNSQGYLDYGNGANFRRRNISPWMKNY